MYFWRTNGKFNQCFCVRSYFSAKWNEALNEHENCIQKAQHSSTHFSFFVRTVAEYEECHCVVRFYLDFCFISYDQWTLFSFEIVVKHVYFEMKQEGKEISFALLIELFKDTSNSIMNFLVYMVPSALSSTLFQIMKKQGVCGFWMSVWFLPRKLIFFDSLTFLCNGKWLLHHISKIYDYMAKTVFHLLDINLISVPFSFVYHTV